jgi:endonuclease/exonuclease/phosphatase family metal-dependent hydrolase
MNSKTYTGGLLLISTVIAILIFIAASCETPATGFDKVEKAVYIEKKNKTAAGEPDSSIVAMTWNIRFGIGRGPWFGDACGYKVIYERDTIIKNLEKLVEAVNEVNPDILLLQEGDINSSRSAYVDEVKWILDNTNFNYAVYGSQWKAQFIPSDGLGRMDEANVIFSRWPLKEGKRIQLDIRSDQGPLEKYFYERCCMVEAKAEIPGFKDIVVVNIHASAFATDNTKHNHIEEFKSELDRIAASGDCFIAGGDLNTLPPGSTKTDYCLEDICQGESYHQPNDNPMHKEGSNYTPEAEWMTPLYNSYKNVILLSDYSADEGKFFTHTTRPEHFWDRTLDYLFTNNRWRTGVSFVRQDFLTLSDHAPVGGELILIKK